MVLSTMIFILVGSDFFICTQADHQCTPVALYENNQYYVFWQDCRFGVTQQKYALCAARVSTTGIVLDPQGKIIYCDSAASIIDAAYDGSNFLVVFRDPNC